MGPIPCCWQHPLFQPPWWAMDAHLQQFSQFQVYCWGDGDHQNSKSHPQRPTPRPTDMAESLERLAMANTDHFNVLLMWRSGKLHHKMKSSMQCYCRFMAAVKSCPMCTPKKMVKAMANPLWHCRDMPSLRQADMEKMPSNMRTPPIFFEHRV